MATKQPEDVRVGYPGLGIRMKAARSGVRAGGRFMSQERMGEILGVSWMTVHRWEDDERTIKYGLLVRFAEACGLYPSHFILVNPKALEVAA